MPFSYGWQTWNEQSLIRTNSLLIAGPVQINDTECQNSYSLHGCNNQDHCKKKENFKQPPFGTGPPDWSAWPKLPFKEKPMSCR